MSSLMELAAKECHVTVDWVGSVVATGPTKVKVLYISKKGNPNKKRKIHRPSAELEILQRWLSLRVFNKLEVHPAAAAFVKNASVLDNARRHEKNSYLVRVDFKDFFWSLTIHDLLECFKNSKTEAFKRLARADINFIQKICFDNAGQLPIGYISSPILSNAIMFEFDNKLNELVKNNVGKVGDGVFTRYADDIVFSTNKAGGCYAFVKLLEKMVKSLKSPRLTINTEKTSYTSRPGGSAIVTGLRICHDGHITISRKQKSEIRLLLSLYAKGTLNEGDVAKLRGHLSYIKHVAPAFYSNLSGKFVESMLKLGS